MHTKTRFFNNSQGWSPSTKLIQTITIICLVFQSVSSQDDPDPEDIVHFGPSDVKNETDPTAPLNSIKFGGLFNLHGGEECNLFRPDNFQRAMAMVYAVEMINRNASLLPGVRLCFAIHDTCTNRNTALRAALTFLPQDTSLDESVTEDTSGIVGAAISPNSIAVASIVQLFEIPQISYASTAERLSNKERYPYFFRTLPTDGQQTEAIADIVRYFNWTYVTIIHTSDVYGRDGAQMLTSELEKSGNNRTTSCVALRVSLRRTASPEDYDDAIDRMLHPLKDRATATVIFGERETAIGVFEAWERRQARGDINRTVTWIASDRWATTLPQHYHKMALGMLGVTPYSRPSSGFDKWLKNLSLNNTAGSPWFNEYWEFAFNCSLTPGGRPRRSPCDRSIRSLAEFTDYAQNDKVSFTIDAVLAFGHALHAMQEDICGVNASGLCSEMTEPRSNRVKGEVLREYLRNVSFSAESMDELKFDEDFNAEGSYTIVNLRKSDNGEVTRLYTVGEWSEGDLSLEDADIRWNTQSGLPPQSFCSEQCALGEFRFPTRNEPCCWDCRKCRRNEISDSRTCRLCPQDQTPDDTKSLCVNLRQTFFGWSNPIAIILLTLSGIGILIAVVGVIIYLIYWRTKLIKSTSRELMAVILLGIILCFTLTVSYIGEPNIASCGIQRVGYYFCITLCFGSLLIKMNRIHRIFNKRTLSTKQPRFISWQSQLVFVAIIILINVAIAVIWLVVEPPMVTMVRRGSEIELRCGFNRFAGPTVENAFVFVLLAGCVYFAIRTRKVPSEYNETRFINITVFSVLLIWLAYVPIYYGTTELSPDIYITSQILSGLFIASLTFTFLVVPKLFLLIVRKRTEIRTILSTTAKHNIILKPPGGDETVDIGIESKEGHFGEFLVGL